MELRHVLLSNHFDIRSIDHTIVPDTHHLMSTTTTPRSLRLLPHGPQPDAYRWTRFVEPKFYSLLDVMRYQHNGRLLLYHGTTLPSLIRMLSRRIDPIGGQMMGKGFYVTANPEMAKYYAYHKCRTASSKGEERGPGVLIQFTVTVYDAVRLRGCLYFNRPIETVNGGGGAGARGSASTSGATSSTTTKVTFYQNHARYQQDDFNFFVNESIDMLQMDTIYLLVGQYNYMNLGNGSSGGMTMTSEGPSIDSTKVESYIKMIMDASDKKDKASKWVDLTELL